MTLDEQHKFFLERPTPTTPMQLNCALKEDEVPNWITKNISKPNLADRYPWEVRWKPEPKTVPAWPPVKPYWVRLNSDEIISAVVHYDQDRIETDNRSYNLEHLKDYQWTTDFKTWHPFTKEVEE